MQYHIWVNMYHVSAQGVDERMISVHYYFYLFFIFPALIFALAVLKYANLRLTVVV